MHKYTRYILGKPSQGIKPNKPFPYIRVSSNNVSDEPWHASGKTSEGEGYVPRAIAQEPNQEMSLTRVRKDQEQKCAIEKNT